MYFPENKAETGSWIFNWKITKSESLAWHGWCWFLISDFLKLRHGAYGFNDGSENIFCRCLIPLYFLWYASYCELFWARLFQSANIFSEIVGFSRKNVLIPDELIAISAEVGLTTWRPKCLALNTCWGLRGVGRKKPENPKKGVVVESDKGLMLFKETVAIFLPLK